MLTLTSQSTVAAGPASSPRITIVRAISRAMTLVCVGFALALTAMVAGGCEADVSDRDIVSIDLAAVRQLVQAEKPGSFKLIDARRPTDFKTGHLPGAMNMTITDLPEGRRLPLDVANAGTVVVYGQNPGSGLARGVAKRIYLSGQKGVRLFEGGYDAWAQAGLPITKPTASSAEPPASPSAAQPASK